MEIAHASDHGMVTIPRTFDRRIKTIPPPPVNLDHLDFYDPWETVEEYVRRMGYLEKKIIKTFNY